jgi:phospholipid-translocating ATPase
VFDLKSGYHQTAIKEEHRWLSAFVTHSAEYEWLRTPFGMKNSGSTFCRVVQEVLKPIKEFTISYVDDMAVGSQSWSEHKDHLNKFFTVMKKSGLTVNLRKTEFAKSQVKFIGHMLGSGSKTPDPGRLGAIKQIARPQSRKQIKSVLGMLGSHRDFIYGYAKLAKPLTDLTSSKVSFSWTDREQIAFDTLKDRLCLATALYTPKIGKLFIIRSDASGVEVAECLNQLIDDSNEVNEKVTGERHVAFCSRKLSPTQCAWSVIEREAYAVIFALKKFHYLIFGAPIIVYSDHNPLAYIVESTSKSAKLVRWSLASQEYDITFRYVRAAHNKSADCLSRLI